MRLITLSSDSVLPAYGRLRFHKSDRPARGPPWCFSSGPRRSVAGAIDRKVDLRHPDWWLRIDILGDRTAIALLKPDELFSLELAHR